MAKVRFNPTIEGIAGRIGKMVYFKVRHSFFGYIREYAYPKLTPQNTKIGKSAHNISMLWKEASQGYKDEMQEYARAYYALGWEGNKLETRANNGFAIFMKAMYAWAKTEDPVIDLMTVTLEDIETLGGKVSSVASCVGYGFLPAIEDWENMEELI